MSASAQTSSKKMRRVSILALLTVFLFSCNGKRMPEYTIQGSDIKEGTVYLWSSDETHRELSSVESNGSFAMSVTMNDSAILTLALPDGSIIPLFAKPGITATLRRDTLLKSGWSVDGGTTQALHDSISRVLDISDEIAWHKKTIETFIARYPISEVNVELFRRYLVEIPQPDNEYIRKSISKLGGVLQDHQYFTSIKKMVDKKNGNIKHKMFPSFNYTSADSTKIDLEKYSNRYLLINFWATWNSKSRESLQNLRMIKEGVRSENFAILNISLDSDSAKWRNAITSDSIIGDNVLDCQGMYSEVMETFNTTSLPYSVLLTPYKRITEYDLTLDSLAAVLIDSLTHRHDTKNEKKSDKKKKNNK